MSILREMSGEEDYARFCRHLRAKHPAEPQPGEAEFYLDRLRHKYTRPSRCC